MPRPKRFDYYMDEVDWSHGHGYHYPNSVRRRYRNQAHLPSDFLDPETWAGHGGGEASSQGRTRSAHTSSEHRTSEKKNARRRAKPNRDAKRGREALADPPSVFSDKRWFPLGHPHKIIPGQGFDTYGWWRHIQGWSAICQPCAVSRPPVLAF